MPKRGVHGALSHDDIRSMIWRQLDTAYLNDDCPSGQWPWLIDVYDGFAIAKIRVNEEYGLWKVPFSVGASGVELGNPSLVADKEGADVRGALQLIASCVTDQDEAAKLLADLKASNPLFAALESAPNAHLVVFDLTTIGRASQHAGKWKYRLAKGGLKAAMPTLIGKPVHVTAGLDGHFDNGEAAKPVGVFMGCTEVEHEDGTSTLRAIANLWDKDFPDLIEVLAKRKGELGASYEILYPATAAAVAAGNVIEISEYQFSGGAILKRTAAAHPETKLHVAQAQPRSAARISVSSTTPVFAGRNPMSKYAGIPAELEAAVDAILAQFSAEQLDPLRAECGVLKADKEKLDGKIVDLTTAKNDLQAQLTQKTEEATAAQSAYAQAQGKLDEQEFAKACAEKMAFISAKYGLSDKQTQEARRIEIVKKLVANKEPVTVEEFDALISGGTGRRIIAPRPNVPLMAGRDEGGPTAEEIGKTYPGATKVRVR